MKPNWQQNLKTALSQSNNIRLNQLKTYSTEAADLFAPVITDSMLDSIDWQNPEDPVLAQFLPHTAESEVKAGFKSDPVGDAAATQVPGLIHKYHGRVLLIASGSCAVNCRYCFRRHFPYSKSFAPRNNWQNCIEYIKKHESIHEVILSGGDPLTLDTDKLTSLTTQLQTIDHIKTLRIHSRIPVVLPMRIDTDFLHWADNLKLKKVMVLHTNHAQEINETAQHAILNLKEAGFTLLNQSVLLKGINDDVKVLKSLSEKLFECDVLPYYLHQMDQVQNAAHFCISDRQAKLIYSELSAALPGYLLPKLVKEIAGELNKTQI